MHGTPGHSSLIFGSEYGYGAVFELARILETFRDSLVGEQYLTFNPGIVLGGTTMDFDAQQSRGNAFGKSNVIAETALAAGDLRTVSVEQRERTKQRMRAIVGRSLPGTSAEITFEDSSEPFSPTPANYALLDRLNAATHAPQPMQAAASIASSAFSFRKSRPLSLPWPSRSPL